MKKKSLFIIAACILAIITSFAQENNSLSDPGLQKYKPWFLRGNKGTDTAVNFIGTTDSMQLVFKVNNQKAGYIGYNSYPDGNTSFGYQSLYLNPTGHSNTANGYQSLYSNTGNQNTANGFATLYSNTTGFANTANGNNALYSNTTGFQNTANGIQTLYFNTTGADNTANGVFALTQNTTGNYNTANGDGALGYNETGNANTANGYSALFSNFSGNYNTALGSYADVGIGNLTNATAIGYKAKVFASNKVRVGNADVTSIGGQVSWSTFSDGRYKKNIKEDVKGLSFINSLRPITYTVDINSLDEYYEKGRRHDSVYAKMKADMQPSADGASKIVYNGFIAQEVEAAATKLNYDFSGVDKPQSNDGLYGLRYAEFVVPLVKAVQELSAKNDAKDAKINDLETRLAKLEAMMNVQQSTVSNQQSINLTSASLDQNVPNPFNHRTSISYTLPQQHSSAKIILVDKTGKVLKETNISGSGKGSLKIDASTLESGAYSYSLYIDGKLIDTKQMMLAK